MKFSYNWIQTFFDTPLPEAAIVAQQVGLHMFELEGTEQLDNGDTIIDWDILPNRSSDCMSYMGIAQEVSAICDIPLIPDVVPSTYQASGDFDTADYIDFVLETDLVPRATKRFVRNVQVGPSPQWLRTALESIGQQSINNVVDITNYVMWTTGQPVHAFDYDKLSGDGPKKYMTIRHATDGEQITDLTGASHELDQSMLVVADAERALDIAGIKGGLHSGVDEHTQQIVVSACNYDFRSIRKTSRVLKLRTDASARYENEVPLSVANSAQALCAQLLEQECGAQAARTVIDTCPDTPSAHTVSVSVSKINQVLGTSIESGQIVEILQRAGFGVEISDQLITVTIPSVRIDIDIPEDIIEEVGRLFGYSHLEPRPIAEGYNIPKQHALYTARDRVAHSLVQLGMYETLSRTLTSQGEVPLQNPLSSEAGYLRSQLLPFLRDKVQANLAHSSEPCFFEIGKVFTGTTNGVVDEHWSWAGILGRKTIKQKQAQQIFLETKGIVETVFDVLQVKDVTWQAGAGDEPAQLYIQDNLLGYVGKHWWEINFNMLVDAIDTTVDYYTPSKYPKIQRDVAVFVPNTTTVAFVQDIITKTGVERCIDTQLFDIFEDSEHDRKSMAFRLTFQCWAQTLSDEYANAEMEKIYTALQKQPGFEIR